MTMDEESEGMMRASRWVHRPAFFADDPFTPRHNAAAISHTLLVSERLMREQGRVDARHGRPRAAIGEEFEVQGSIKSASDAYQEGYDEGCAKT